VVQVVVEEPLQQQPQRHAAAVAVAVDVPQY
jgi:hypothetical protein